MSATAFSAVPWESPLGLNIFKSLDPSDYMEADMIRGGGATSLDLFCDWRNLQVNAPLSMILRWHEQPFAVLALGNTGQSGVACASMLAKNHQRYRRGLSLAGAHIRMQLPEYCEDMGIHRIEARCWKNHPTASRFLALCGFKHEVDMIGFGSDGHQIFRQFSWTKEKKER